MIYRNALGPISVVKIYWLNTVFTGLTFTKGEPAMLSVEGKRKFLLGPEGTIEIPDGDEITLKLAMLIEGQCAGLGATAAAREFGYSKQRYFQQHFQ